jgi:hypothetical protein
MLMNNGVTGISTSLFADNSTSFLLQNSRFTNVGAIVRDDFQHTTLLAGGTGTTNVDSWGFGKVSNSTGDIAFVNAHSIAFPARPEDLTKVGTMGSSQRHFFSRRRPSYANLGNSQLMDVKAYGAKGDGTSDDTVVLNYIFSAAANMSAIVYIPFGVYLVRDTVVIPVGSRIIGQAWPQIMGTGPKFADMNHPRTVVKVGEPGTSGVIEIQSMMFTVKGPTAGAVLVEWNVHESFQGSAGLWGELQPYCRLAGVFPLADSIHCEIILDSQLTASRLSLPRRWCTGNELAIGKLPQTHWRH